MKRVGALFVALMTVIVTGTPASAWWNYPDKCSLCHATNPNVVVTLTENGACVGGEKPYSFTVSNTNGGMEGWAVFNPSTNVRNGVGNLATFMLGSGSYEIHGVSGYGSWQTANLGGSNKVFAFVPPCPAACTDGDQDGYNAAGTGCGPADCNDGNAGIYPNAPEAVGDGIDQDCNGYDLTVVVTKATYSARKTTLSVTATSGFGAGANLTLVGFGPMKWSSRNQSWSLSVVTSPKPANVTVQGFEGSVSVPVQ
jgi:hypothetical protein